MNPFSASPLLVIRQCLASLFLLLRRLLLVSLFLLLRRLLLASLFLLLRRLRLIIIFFGLPVLRLGFSVSSLYLCFACKREENVNKIDNFLIFSILRLTVVMVREAAYKALFPLALHCFHHRKKGENKSVKRTA